MKNAKLVFLCLTLVAWEPVSGATFAFGQDLARIPNGAAAARQGAPGDQNLDDKLRAQSERIVQLTRQIQADRAQLHDAQEALNHPAGEYFNALAEFQDFDSQVASMSMKLKLLKDGGKKKELVPLEKQLSSLNEKLGLARKRFILALRERQILRDQIATLHEKTRKEYEDLNAASGLSDVERMAAINASLELDAARLASTKADLKQNEESYFKSQAKIEELGEQLQKANAELSALKNQKKLKEIEAKVNEIADLDKAWKKTKGEFEVVHEKRRAQYQAVATAEKSMRYRRDLLEQITTGWSLVKVDNAAPGAPNPAVKDNTPAPEKEKPPGKGVALPPGVVPGIPIPNPAPKNPPSGDNGKPPDLVDQKEFKDAQEKAKAKETASQKASDSVLRLNVLVERVKKLIDQEKRLVSTFQDQLKNAEDSRKDLEKELAEKKAKGAPAADLAAIEKKLREIDERVPAAKVAIAKSNDKVRDLNLELTNLQQTQATAAREAEAIQHEAEAAQKHIRDLQNPLSLQNIWRWVYRRGPSVFVILLIMLGLHWLFKIFAKRIVNLLSKYATRGSEAERQNRAETLVGVFQNFATTVIFVAGGLMILNELGIDVGLLMGGAAIIGLAVAFGAQNLIRDYFYGFIILMENQYIVRDVVKIGAISGVVERITLRMTVLRDLEGTVHFIPNGQITAVGNMTQEWSRALFDVPVAYKENLDNVVEALRKIGNELRSDDAFMPVILEDLKMLGVESFGDSGVVIRFYIQTWPGKQWDVKREMLRRIKNRFDELKIEIPFSQHTVFLRNENQNGEESAPASSTDSGGRQ